MIPNARERSSLFEQVTFSYDGRQNVLEVPYRGGATGHRPYGGSIVTFQLPAHHVWRAVRLGIRLHFDHPGRDPLETLKHAVSSGKVELYIENKRRVSLPFWSFVDKAIATPAEAEEMSELSEDPLEALAILASLQEAAQLGLAASIGLSTPLVFEGGRNVQVHFTLGHQVITALSAIEQAGGVYQIGVYFVGVAVSELM